MLLSNFGTRATSFLSIVKGSTKIKLTIEKMIQQLCKMEMVVFKRNEHLFLFVRVVGDKAKFIHAKCTNFFVLPTG